MNSLKRSIFLSLCLALGLAGCPAPNPLADVVNPGTDVVNPGSDVPGNEGGPGLDVVNNTDGGDVQSTAGNLSCAELAQRACTRLNTCTPHIFRRSFEDQARCVDYQTDVCELGRARSVGAPFRAADPAACQTALDSCPAYLGLSTMIPAACQPATGPGQNGDSCSNDSQCGAGLYCFGSAGDLACGDGVCANPDGVGSANTCNMPIAQGLRDPCDTRNNFRCTKLFDSTMPPTYTGDNNAFRCRTVTYGTANSACLDGSNQQCASGFKCVNRVCLGVLGENSPCDGALSGLCDDRLGLSCQPVPNSTNFSCRPTPFAQIGAQCGPVTEGGVTENRQCASLVARCSTAVPPVCEALKDLNQPCTSTPDNCRGPYVCRAGTCQEPTAPTCP